MSSIEQTDAESQSVVKNPGTRVSLAQIEAAIESKYFVTGTGALEGRILSVMADRHLNAMTLCFLIMTNGFVVVGKSAPLDPGNFDADLGKKFAYEDAIRQLWPLMAFSRLDVLADP